MKHLLLILLALVSPCMLHAQGDTLLHAPLRPRTEPLVGSLLFSGATIITLTPQMHELEIRMHDRLGLADVDRQPFDNVLQFVPIATPLLLKAVGMKSQHDVGQMLLLGGTATLIGMAAVGTGKKLYQIQRPDGSAMNSFPSGHTYIAFTGAEMLRREFGKDYPWVTYVGYGVAALVGAMRVYNSRHWPSDVLGGAGVALLSVSASYWLFGK